MGQDLPSKPVTSVQRFDGRDLGQAPHIAVLGSCKLGNFVATLPLLRLLQTPLPKCTNRFLGQRSHRRLRARALRRRPAPRLANLLGQAKS